MNDRTLRNTTFVKTILMILVILGHACAFWSGHWFTENPIIPSRSLDTLYAWINSYHIYGFALVSGYIFVFKIMSGGYSDFLQFLCNKVKRLLVPYLFVALIWVAPVSAFFFDWDIGYVIIKYLLAIDPSQLWFLWMLFGVFVIVWPIRKLMMERPIAGYGISILLYGVGIIGRHVIPNIFCVWTTCQYVLFFFIGMRIRTREEKQERLIIESLPWYCWVIVDLLLFAGTIMVGQYSGKAWNLVTIMLNMILHIVGAVMVWTILQTLADKIKWKDSKAFKTLSLYSMPMYLFHQQIIYFTITWLNGKVNPWIHAGMNFISALAGSFLISAFLMHWKTTRSLIGEK